MMSAHGQSNASAAGVRHSSADIEAGATVADDANVWHYCHIRSGATVGSGTQLGRNVYVDIDVSVGARVKVQNNVSIYRGVTIEDDVFVGPDAVFTNDRVPRASGDWEIVATRVRRGASVGANATILCGLEVGEYAMVAAGAVVTTTVRHHELVGGNPARHLGWVCRCGRTVSRDDARPDLLECPDCAAAGPT